MMYRRPKQIKKAEMMSNPLVLFGVSFMTPDGKDVFGDSKSNGRVEKYKI